MKYTTEIERQGDVLVTILCNAYVYTPPVTYWFVSYKMGMGGLGLLDLCKERFYFFSMTGSGLGKGLRSVIFQSQWFLNLHVTTQCHTCIITLAFLLLSWGKTTFLLVRVYLCEGYAGAEEGLLHREKLIVWCVYLDTDEWWAGRRGVGMIWWWHAMCM